MKKTKLEKHYEDIGRKGIEVLQKKLGKKKFIAHMKYISALGVKARKRLRLANK